MPKRETRRRRDAGQQTASQGDLRVSFLFYFIYFFTFEWLSCSKIVSGVY